MMTSKFGRRDAARAEQALIPRIEILEGRQLLSAAVTSALDAAGLSPRSAALTAAPRSAADEAATASPTVRSTTPAAGSTGFDINGAIVAFVNLPNVAGVTDDPAILKANVRLYRAGDVNRIPIPGNPNTTGGGDAIIF